MDESDLSKYTPEQRRTLAEAFDKQSKKWGPEFLDEAMLPIIDADDVELFDDYIDYFEKDLELEDMFWQILTRDAINILTKSKKIDADRFLYKRGYSYIYPIFLHQFTKESLAQNRGTEPNVIPLRIEKYLREINGVTLPDSLELLSKSEYSFSTIKGFLEENGEDIDEEMLMDAPNIVRNIIRDDREKGDFSDTKSLIEIFPFLTEWKEIVKVFYTVRDKETIERYRMGFKFDVRGAEVTAHAKVFIFTDDPEMLELLLKHSGVKKWIGEIKAGLRGLPTSNEAAAILRKYL